MRASADDGFYKRKPSAAQSSAITDFEAAAELNPTAQFLRFSLIADIERQAGSVILGGVSA